MSHSHQITDAYAASQFLLGGKAKFSLKGARHHFSYKIVAPKDGKCAGKLFVYGIRGSENREDYMGMIVWNRGVPTVKQTMKTMFRAEDPQVAAINWTLRHVHKAAAALEDMPAGLELWHFGQCGMCCRPLRDPDSIARGIGPVCWKRIAKAAA